MRIKHKNEAPRTRNRVSNESSLRQSQKSYSYSSRRSEETYNVGRGEKPKQTLKQTSTSASRKFGLIVLLIAIIVSAIKVLSLSSTPIIKFVGSSSDNALTNKNGTSVYERAVSSYLSSSIWNTNKLTLDSSGLSNYLTGHHPELQAVSVSVPFIDNHLVVYLTPTSPTITLVEPNAAYALDASGRAILKASSASALNLSLPVVTDQSGLSVSLGKMAITSDDVFFIREIVGQLSIKGYKVSSLTLPANTDELDAYLAGQSYYIKFNLNENDPRQQAGTFLATISSLKSQNSLPTKYVDVRVDGRAYYQ